MPLTSGLSNNLKPTSSGGWDLQAPNLTGGGAMGGPWGNVKMDSNGPMGLSYANMQPETANMGAASYLQPNPHAATPWSFQAPDVFGNSQPLGPYAPKQAGL